MLNKLLAASCVDIFLLCCAPELFETLVMTKQLDADLDEDDEKRNWKSV